MTNFFELTPAITKPYALMDLDDTLFQTMRKIETWQLPNDNLTIATVNKQGEPLSYFTPKQAHFFNWLSHATELIPVTARDTVEIQRVKLPFNSWQVLTHGAVILQNDGQILASWQQQMGEQLSPLQDQIYDLQNLIQQHFGDLQLRFTVHNESFGANLGVYLAIKQRDKNHTVLENLAKDLPLKISTLSQDFYIHVNANNLAILPNCVNKNHAVAFLLEHYLDNQIPTFGFGDSIADLPFLQRLDWYGTPSRGQLHEHIGE